MLTPITQGVCKPFTFKALDLWHEVRVRPVLHMHIHMHLHILLHSNLHLYLCVEVNQLHTYSQTRELTNLMHMHLHILLHSHLHIYLYVEVHQLHTYSQNCEFANLMITVDVGPSSTRGSMTCRR